MNMQSESDKQAAARIAIDGIKPIQVRAKFDQETIDRYVELVPAEGEWALPPIVVVQDGHGKQYCPDGNHRLRAYAQAGRKDISAVLVSGTKLHAIELAVAANSDHGLPRTRADRRKAVRTLLRSSKAWRSASVKRIADHCHVSQALAKSVKQEVLAELKESTAVVIGKDGRKQKAIREPGHKTSTSQLRSQTDGNEPDESARACESCGAAITDRNRVSIDSDLCCDCGSEPEQAAETADSPKSKPVNAKPEPQVDFDEFADLEERVNKINRVAWRVVFSGNDMALWFLKTVVERILNATNEEIEKLPSPADEHKADADDWLDELFAKLATAGDKALKYFGLNRRSTLDELNAIFRQQSAVMHPDAGGDAEEYQQLAQRFSDAKLLLSGKAESK